MTRMKTKTTRMTNKRASYLFLLLPLSAVLLAVIVSNFAFCLLYVPSGSMADTLPEKSVLIGSRLAYREQSPARGDLVFFTHPELGRTTLIKRVIAVGGDTFEIKNGTVYLNGAVLDEPYISTASAEDFPLVTVPEGKLLLLGDNRVASHDARAWEDPFVDEANVKGKVIFILFPSFSQP